MEGMTDMVEMQKDSLNETAEKTVEPETEDNAKKASGSAFENIYDRLPDISIRSLDRFIAICIIALIAVILIGVLKANHILDF